MRIAVDALRWRGNADLGEPVDRPLPRLALRVSDRCARIVSVSWSPTRISGLRLVSGSWKIMPMRRPRSARIRAGGRLSMRSPSSRISPPRDMAGRIEKPDDGEPGERFSGPGFADDAENLARRDIERRLRRAQSAGPVSWRIRRADREPKAARRSFQPWDSEHRAASRREDSPTRPGSRAPRSETPRSTIRPRRGSSDRCESMFRAKAQSAEGRRRGRRASLR